MEAAPPPTATAPAIQVNQAATAVQINQPNSSHAEDRKRLPYYNSKAAVSTGIIQISCGLVAMMLEIMYLTGLEFLYPEDKASVGIWSGGFFIFTGVIGLFSFKKKRGMVIVYFVFSIISSVIALVGFTFAIMHLTSHRWIYNPDEGIVLAVSVVSIIVNIIEGLTAIVASSFGCAAKPCCDGQPVIQERVVYMAPLGPTHANDVSHVPMGLPPSYEANPQVAEKY